MDAQKLNEKLADFPYVGGYTPSQADVDQLKSLPAGHEKYVHITRWTKHMASFKEAEKKAFPGAPSSAAKKGGDDDDDIDLFGSDDEEDEEAEKAREERVKQMAAKKAGKPAVIAKSNVVIDVKVWDDETDLDEVEKQVRAIEMDGLRWGAAQKKPLAFGVFKLQICCVVEDAKVSIDNVTEQIEELDLVQSTDIAAFQKV